ncbi:hypothetical protein ILUMI_06291 [Ignelater luminosus]|uniref:Uncharacterized protein n=1 Tax=Ignelater luminosus TaxID=2038154 RepID=A0A8K0GCQ8_IGNLU|nr:hypothetical protein ILUMI_06291 [Ignelater luminosus]
MGKVDSIVKTTLGHYVVTNLTRSLVEEELYACGKARENRPGILNDLKDDKVLKRGDSDWCASTKEIITISGGTACLYFLDTAEMNVFILFQDRFPSKMTLKGFRLNVFTKLISAQHNVSKRERKYVEKLMKRFKTRNKVQQKCAYAYPNDLALRIL